MRWREPREDDPIPSNLDPEVRITIDAGIAFAAEMFAPRPPPDLDVRLAKELARLNGYKMPSGVRRLLEGAFLFGASCAVLYTADLPQEDLWIGIRWAVESQRQLTMAFLELPGPLRHGLVGYVSPTADCDRWTVCLRGAAAAAQCAYHFHSEGMRVFLPKAKEDAIQKIDLIAVAPGMDSGLLLQVKNIRNQWSRVRFLDDRSEQTPESARLQDVVSKLNNLYRANWKGVMVHVGMISADFRKFENSRHLSDSIRAFLSDPRLRKR